MNSAMEEDAAFRARLSQLVGNDRPFEWAKAAGIPSSTWNRAWNEGTVPKARHLARIASHARVTLDWLITGQGPMRRRALTGRPGSTDPGAPGLDSYPLPEATMSGEHPCSLDEGLPETYGPSSVPVPFQSGARPSPGTGMSLVSGTFTPSGSSLEGTPAPLSSGPVRIDEELLGSLIDGIHRAYSESRHEVSPRELGRIAARMLGDLGELCETIEEQRLAIRAMLAQLRRTLQDPPASSPAEDYLPRADELEPLPEEPQDTNDGE